MPAIFAHWLFGKRAIDTLSESSKKLISKNIRVFNLGLQGPDFLFFKNFSMDKKSLNFGGDLHQKTAREILQVFKSELDKEYSDIKLAYILGFIGHYTLDSHAHDYINRIVDEKGVDHNELETEFDRFLMLGENLHPFDVKVEKYIFTTKEEAHEIAKLYLPFDILNENELVKSIKDFYTTKIGIRRLQKYAPWLVKFIMKAAKVWDKLYGIILQKEINKSLSPYIEEVYSIFLKSLYKYPSFIGGFSEYLEGKELNENFNTTFERR